MEYDPKAYIEAMNSMSPGDFITIFTPDDTHFDVRLFSGRSKWFRWPKKPSCEVFT